ncbi:hypothetical protein G6011_03912 [Alternaria panax]|uniref:Uncharacterized protein n=1 Tax=Alternaria panax TaxID=48097 RepID=A0AAD4IG20_9PLEO|nr:hypothetical protein G6011_03912 [Alternaria panax]
MSTFGDACRFPHEYEPLSIMGINSYLEKWWTECKVQHAVLRTITWINKATSLAWSRSTRVSLTTHFVGPYDIIQLIWNKVRSVATLYAAPVICTHEQQSLFPTRDDLALAFTDEDNATSSNPELLPASVKHIISKNFLVRIPCILDTMEEFDLEAHRKSILEGVLEDD